MTATESAQNWRSAAACRSADPDLFFPVSATGPAVRQIARAKTICAGCGVRRECLDHIVVFGGRTCVMRCCVTRSTTTRCARIYRWTKMRPSDVRLKPPDASERSLSSADCIINTSGSDLRQGQVERDALRSLERPPP